MSITQEDNLIIQSYITISFITELKNNNFLSSDYYKSLNFENKSVKQLLSKIEIDNQGTLLLSLYSMLVIPKELLLSKYPKQFKSLNKKIEKLTSKEHSTYSFDKDQIDYVGHIRNAVAHMRVKFVPNKTVTFEDQNPKNNDVCSITIPLKKIGILLIELQKIFNKYIDDLKS